MQQKILMSISSCWQQIAVMQDEVCVDFKINNVSDTSLVGNVYIGKIVRFQKNLQAFFIDIGLSQNAYLQVDELIQSNASNNKLTVDEFISKLTQDYYVGRCILVQVIKDAIGSKAPKVTTRISCYNDRLVFRNSDTLDINFSKNFTKSFDKKSLIQVIKEKLKDINQKGEIVIRSNATLYETNNDLLDDLLLIVAKWQNLQLKFKHLLTQNKNIKPQLLQQESTVLQFIIPYLKTPTQIYLSSEAFKEELLNFLKDKISAKYLDNIAIICNENEIANIHKTIDSIISHCSQKEVTLSNKGNLVIEQTEALTSIDVNSASYTSKQYSEESILEVNLAAAKAIAREVRLRNIAGQILVDFINMKSKVNKEKLLSCLKSELSKDQVHCEVLGFTALGIVEFSRKRTSESLIHHITTVCPCCNGLGLVYSAEFLAEKVWNLIRTQLLLKHLIGKYHLIKHINISCDINTKEEFLQKYRVDSIFNGLNQKLSFNLHTNTDIKNCVNLDNLVNVDIEI